MMVRAFLAIVVLGFATFFARAAHPVSFRIVSTASVNGNEIGICFNDLVDIRTATDATHYHLSDTNIVVTNAIVRSDSRSVLLQLSREIVGYSFVLIAPDIRNYEGSPLSNPIVAGGVLGHDTGGLDNTDIGTVGIDPKERGTVFGCTNRLFSREFEVLAAGSGIGGQSDAFHYVYHRGGHQFFSLFVHIANLSVTNGSGQAGLMVRESLSHQSRHLSVIITASGPVGGEITTIHRETEGGLSAEWLGSKKMSGVTFPVYLILQRDGPTFSAYASTNGMESILLAKVEPTPSFANWPETTLMGTATSSRNNASGAIARVQYQYGVQPHGDVFPRFDVVRQGGTLTLRWPNVTILESSEMRSVQPIWTPVTNNVDFGSFYTSQWTFELPRSADQRFFRLRFP